MASAKKLVIVESPTKAKTIRKFLGSDYRVEASMGHVRDLPGNAAEVPEKHKGEKWANLGVNIAKGFEPLYIVPASKKATVTELRKALKDADELYIATDEDREGEAIGWHLLELLKPKVPTHRMVFNEITKAAIQRALESPRELDMRLVNAQEARRVLDRLVGYTVSPLLWKKVGPRLSAGRVQSAAVRMLVLRERERIAFVRGSYWGVKAGVRAEKQPFNAELHTVDGTRVATGRDFDENTGRILDGRDVLLLEETRARALSEALEKGRWTVKDVDRKESTRRAYPPFTTSTLQQEANRKLGLSARDTMSQAQKLYEKGLITYMRTDSVNLSQEAVHAARGRIESQYGKNFLSNTPRQFTTKSKGAQEAHEAIRPAGTEMRTAEEHGLRGMEQRLYELIWMRTMATQMADARIANTTATLEASAGDETVTFRASGREVVFPGFLRAYVEGADDPAAALDDQNAPLPTLSVGQTIDVDSVTPEGHETRPPARYTEASLVKALEANGIGRPSTFASIIHTIQNRGYVVMKQKQLVPTFTAMAVTRLLEETHAHIVDFEFTAAMEDKLDQIASAKDSLAYLESFYNDQVMAGMATGAELDPREIGTLHYDSFAPIVVRVGRYGPYLEAPSEVEDEKGRTASIPDDTAPADLTPELVAELLDRAEKGDEALGQDPETGLDVYVLTGRFGPYMQLGEATDGEKPKRISVPKGISPDDIDLETALAYLALPREVGIHPETGKKISTTIGRFGPYVLHDGVYASLKATDHVLTVDLNRALELFEEKAKGGGRRGATPTRVLGEHPDGGEIGVYDGRYGPYVKHAKTNATIPKDRDPESITLEEAIELIAARAAKAPAKKTTTRKAPAKKPAAKTAAAKKTTAAAKKTTTAAKTAAAKTTAAKTTAAKKPAAKKTTAAKD